MTSILDLDSQGHPVDGSPPGPPPPPGPGRHDPHRGRRRFAALALALAGAVGGGITGHVLFPGTHPTAAYVPSGGGPVVPAQPSADTGGATGGGTTSAGSVAAAVAPGIVDINTVIGYQNAQAAGTGMVLTSTGEVLTNNHAIAGATAISVTDVGNGKTYAATVVGYDKTDDVAVLKLQHASGLATVRTASAAVATGTDVVAIGNAGGTGGTPTYAAGVITGTDQAITATDSSDGTSEQLTGLLETDADIVAGDSGGPLVTRDGEVVGMDTAASSGFRFSQNSDGYAIPITRALQIADRIEAGRSSSTVHVGGTAMLGVGVESGVGFGSSAPGGQAAGAVVTQVVDGGPAASAGIGAGDTITAVAGRTVTSASDLSGIILQQRPEATVSVEYVDASGVTRTAAVRLVTGPPQ